MTKPQQILDLEKHYNLSLSPVHNIEEISFLFSIHKNAYYIDEKQQILGLNLRSNKITDISALKSLINLTSLDLRDNQITDISALKSMINLTSLNLYSNQITDISALKSMINLTRLNLYSNQITDISALKSMINLTRLNLYSNQITDISAIQSMTNLNSLDLSSNQITDISALQSMAVLTSLNLSSNQITDLSAIIHLIKSIKINVDKDIHFKGLFLEENPLEYPPMEIYVKGNNEIINWFNNKILIANELIEENLNQKTKEMDLGNLGLTDLSLLPKLFECTHLESLILSNHYGEYNHINDEWEKKESKNNLYPNNISHIPKEIAKLINLKKLIVGGDWKKGKKWNRFRIKDISNLYQLTKLEKLNVSNNEIENITDLKKLKKLNTLYGNNNKISSISDLAKSKYLKDLFLSNNKLKSVDFLKNLVNIKTIDLHSNEITNLSEIINLIYKINDIQDEKWLMDTICVADNPLVVPSIEFVRRGVAAVINIIKEINEGPSFKNKDIKMILVGNSEVGKTTLANYLNTKKISTDKHPYTLWMNEIEATILEKNIRILDFGGHDYYHDTHHIFFGTNALYILLWDTGSNNIATRELRQIDEKNNSITTIVQDYPLKYWMDSIAFYTKKKEAENFGFEIDAKKTSESFNSHLLIVQNKVEEFKDIEFLITDKRQENYPFIYDAINVDLYKGRNINHLDTLIKEMVVKSKFIDKQFPRYYDYIRQSMGLDTALKYSYTLEEFLTYCLKHKSSLDLENTKGIIYYLDSIGIILYDEKNEIVFCNINKLSRDFIAIFSNLNGMNGVFGESYAKDKLGEGYQNILDLMTSYKLIFRLPLDADKLEYASPLYLPAEPNKLVKIFTENKTIIPYRRFIYEGFIHKSIILNIFSEYAGIILKDEVSKNSYFWKDGLIIKNPIDGELIMLTFDIGDIEGNAYIEIKRLVKSNNNEFVKKIIDYIDEINKGYEIEEMVTLDGKDFVSKKLLNSNAKKGKLVFNERRIGDINTEQETQQKSIILKDYNMYLDDSIKKQKVVISYSKKDLKEIHTLIRYLRPLIDNELIEEPWYCTVSNPGDVWDEKIQTKFKEADIVFFMISEYFYSTKYIKEKEIPLVIDRYKNGEKVKIVSIILEHYDWGRKGPYNLQPYTVLPYQAKPISDFNNPKIAWNTITESVKAMIEKDLDPSKSELLSRTLEEIYERQVNKKLDYNS